MQPDRLSKMYSLVRELEDVGPDDWNEIKCQVETTFLTKEKLNNIDIEDLRDLSDLVDLVAEKRYLVPVTITGFLEICNNIYWAHEVMSDPTWSNYHCRVNSISVETEFASVDTVSKNQGASGLLGTLTLNPNPSTKLFSNKEIPSEIVKYRTKINEMVTKYAMTTQEVINQLVKFRHLKQLTRNY